MTFCVYILSSETAAVSAASAVVVGVTAVLYVGTMAAAVRYSTISRLQVLHQLL
jgi:hypothetical protein